jgi:LPXTG-site transpeptidase (sortase) family protein
VGHLAESGRPRRLSAFGSPVQLLLWGRERNGEAQAAAAVTALLVTAVVIAAAGVVTAVSRGIDGSKPVASALPAPRQAGGGVRHPTIEPGAQPLRLRIPVIGVDTPLVALGLNGDGTLEVPRYEEAGWFAGGSRPGETGASVLAAHVDSTTGPAVFHRLDDLEPGDEVFVDYRDATVGFAVRDTRSVTKTRFPTQEVYGSTPAPELRLVTCAGDFDRRSGTYTANLIVWADLLDAA